MARDKYWRDDNSIEAADLTPEDRAKIRRNRLRFEEDQKAMESWAAGGFTSAFGADDPVEPFDEEERNE